MVDTLDEVAIGDFSKPLSDPSRSRGIPPGVPLPKVAGAPKPSPAPAPPVNDKLAQEEAKLASQVAAAEREAKPQLEYEKVLKDHDISREEAAEIVNSIIEKGSWSKTIPITKSTSIRLRTRHARDTRRMLQYIETVKPQTDTHYTEIMWLHLTASSLESFGSTDFAFPPETAPDKEHNAAFDVRLQFIENRPELVKQLLFSKMTEFDNLTRGVMRPGVVENF